MVQIFKQINYGFIPRQAVVKYTLMGNITEIMYMKKIKKDFGIRKINKDKYMNLYTGEICGYKHSQKRIENIDNIRETLKHIRELINTNFFGLPNEKFFTITYKENMTDPVKLYKDVEKFFKRLRCKYPDFDYLSIIEPQGRGAWHCHILFKFYNIVDSKFWIKSSDIEKNVGKRNCKSKGN